MRSNSTRGLPLHERTVPRAATDDVAVRERFTADGLAVRNADHVAAALEAAGIAHVRLGCPTTLRRVVGVEQADLPAAIRALTTAGPALRAAVPPGGERRPLDSALADLDPEGEGRLWLFEPVSDPRGDLVLDAEVACELQVLTRLGDKVRAPRQTSWGRWLPAAVLTEGPAALPELPADEITFPIDAVYTWVDDRDPAWVAARDEALRAQGHTVTHAANVGDSRFRNRDELRYSLRSLAMYAPFIRHVYLVTAGQVPEWLDLDCPRISVVPHEEIFTDPAHLPTFNSHAIELHLHRIEGLSEHYLYINDDFLFGRPVRPELFFHANGITKHFRSKALIPPGPPTPEDVGVDAAAKNGRALLEESFGVRVAHKFKHVPQPQRRTRVEALLERFAAELGPTAASRFRHPDDYSLPSSLVHHFGHLTGTSVPGRIRYDYIGLDDLERAEERFADVLRWRDRDTICINDAHVPDHDAARADRLVASFLERFLPVPSEFERT